MSNFSIYEVYAEYQDVALYIYTNRPDEKIKLSPIENKNKKKHSPNTDPHLNSLLDMDEIVERDRRNKQTHIHRVINQKFKTHPELVDILMDGESFDDTADETEWNCWYTYEQIASGLSKTEAQDKIAQLIQDNGMCANTKLPGVTRRCGKSEYDKNRRQQMTEEQKQQMRNNKKTYNKTRYDTMTDDQKQLLKSKQKEYNKIKRETETPEQREKRLAYNKKWYSKNKQTTTKQKTKSDAKWHLETVQCLCGQAVTQSNLSRHKKTKRCIAKHQQMAHSI